MRGPITQAQTTSNKITAVRTVFPSRASTINIRCLYVGGGGGGWGEGASGGRRVRIESACIVIKSTCKQYVLLAITDAESALGRPVYLHVVSVCLYECSDVHTLS